MEKLFTRVLGSTSSSSSTSAISSAAGSSSGRSANRVIVGADVDVQRLQGVVELIHLLALQIQVIHRVHQICGVQLALLLTAGPAVPAVFRCSSASWRREGPPPACRPAGGCRPSWPPRPSNDGGASWAVSSPFFRVVFWQLLQPAPSPRPSPGAFCGRPEARLPVSSAPRGSTQTFCHAAFLQYPFLSLYFSVAASSGSAVLTPGPLVRLLLYDAYVIRQRLFRVLQRFRLLADAGRWIHLLLGEELRSKPPGRDASGRLGLPEQGEGTAQQGGGELLLPQGRLLREQALVPESAAAGCPSSARAERMLSYRRLPLLGLELGRRIQVPPQLRPFLLGERRLKARWTSSLMASGVILAVSAARVV